MKTGYIAELDGVRALSILLVLATHLLPVGPSFLHLNAMTGLMGMSLFFCLSGFLITRFLCDSPNVGVFLVRRIGRIYPLLVLYALLVAGLMFWRWDSVAGILLFYYNYDDILLYKGVSHLWSICVEMHFYAGIALTVFLFGRRGFWLVPVCAAVVLWLRIDAGAYANIRTHLRVDEILSGSLLALLWQHRTHPLAARFGRLLVAGFLPLVAIWLLSCHEIGGPVQYGRPYFAMAVVGAVLFMPECAIRRFLRLGPLRYVANISYALYIWHPMTALGWLSGGDRWQLYLIKRPISFALTFLLAHISTHTLEKYFIDRSKEVRPRSLVAAPGS